MSASCSCYSSTSASNNGTNGSSNGSDSVRSDVQPVNPEVFQHSMPLQWNGIQVQKMVPMIMKNVIDVQNVINQLNSPTYIMYMPYQVLPIFTSNIIMSPSIGVNGSMIDIDNGHIAGGANLLSETVKQCECEPPTETTNNTSDFKIQLRVRTAFTSQQIKELEKEYSKSRYLDRVRKIKLANLLRISQNTIKIWFQNRRMREKKDTTEILDQSEDVSTTQPCLIDDPGDENLSYNPRGLCIEQQHPQSPSTTESVSGISTTMPQIAGSVQNVHHNHTQEQEISSTCNI